MFRISRFQQLLQAVPRGRFDSLVERYQGNRYAKSFGCYDLLVAQLFGHLNGSRSLREIETGFNAHGAHHYHLGARAIRRSTLADACATRSPAVFEELAKWLMASAQRRVRRAGIECLRLLDSTSFTLKGRGFDAWAAVSRTRHTQGLKLHIVYDPDQAVPTLQQITTATVNDVTQAQTLPITRGATYVFDKGYCDYNWWARINAQDAKFITRLKSNAKIRSLTSRLVPAEPSAMVLGDEEITLSNKNPGAGRKNTYTAVLRRVTVARPGKDKPLVLVTNDLERSAEQVAECYKARWQIELFFKWIKQNLRIRAFFGRSENAVRLQILCALIAYLLVALHRLTHAPAKPMIRVLDELRAALFQRPQLDAVVERRRRQRCVAQIAVQPILL
jgi:FOG: Transposase and inactivated derivatives